MEEKDINTPGVSPSESAEDIKPFTGDENVDTTNNANEEVKEEVKEEKVVEKAAEPQSAEMNYVDKKMRIVRLYSENAEW